MKEVLKESRLTQLKSLLEVLATAIDQKPGARDLAGLSKQYREVLLEIQEIEGVKSDGDDISRILSRRKAHGKSDAVR